MLEDRPVAMPADAGARIVAGHKCLHERLVGQAREGCGPGADREQ